MNDIPLLTRNQFREDVFSRDSDRCVICGNDAVDAHHIMERSLWNDGGYYIDNGASVCASCHIKCETTEISVGHVREFAGITRELLPTLEMGWSNYSRQMDLYHHLMILSSTLGHIIYHGPIKLKALAYDLDYEMSEGYVARVSDSFHYLNFATLVAKFVRRDHVQTDSHWMHGPIIANGIA